MLRWCPSERIRENRSGVFTDILDRHDLLCVNKSSDPSEMADSDVGDLDMDRFEYSEYSDSDTNSDMTLSDRDSDSGSNLESGDYSQYSDDQCPDYGSESPLREWSEDCCVGRIVVGYDEDENCLEDIRAAIIIQRNWRDFLLRRTEKVRETAAIVIQNKWLDAYYDPKHTVCKTRLTHECGVLQNEFNDYNE